MSSRIVTGICSFVCLFGWQARAADLPSKVVPPVFVPPAGVTWTGCYLGAEGGASVAHTRSTGLGLNNGAPIAIPAGTPKNNTHFDGGLLGGDIGCNYSFNRIVAGVEGDGAYADVRGSSITPPPFNTNFNEDPRQRWLATIRGRLGVLLLPDVLVYGTAGGAFSELRIHEYSRVTGIGASEGHTYAGWTAGGGIEWLVAPHWSVKAEYLYADLGKKDYFAATATGCCSFQRTRFTDQIVRIGLNYHFDFGMPPVVARY